MWFLLGFVTLTCFVLVSIVKRHRSSWKGDEAQSDAGPYQTKLFRNQLLRLMGGWVGIPCPSEYDFRLKPERWHDRLFKSFGIAAEYEVGDAEFDDRLYIVSDDRAFCVRLRLDSELRQKILSVFERAKQFRCKVSQIRCHNGRLWVVYHRLPDMTESDLHAAARDSVPTLYDINATLEASKGLTPAERDPFVWRAAIVLGLSTGLVIYGFVHGLRWVLDPLPLLLDYAQLMFASVAVGLAIVVMLVALALKLLDNSARTHLVLIELLLLGTFGAVTSSATLLTDLNTALDPVEDGVVRSSTVRHVGKRGRSEYYVVVDNWTGTEPTREVLVERGRFKSHDVGKPALILESPGFLGFRWVRDAVPSP